MTLLRITLALALVLSTAACDDRTRPDATGSIAIQLVATPDAGGPEAAAANGEVATSPAAPMTHLDSAKVNVSGGTTNFTQLLTKNGTTNFTGTVTSIPVSGSYTVTAFGYYQNAVDYAGRTTGVTVTANQTTTANVLFNSFVPGGGGAPTAAVGFTGLPTTTTAFRVNGTFTTLAAADSYKVEVANNAAFTGAVTMTPWPKTSPATITFSPTTLPQIQYMRISSANSIVPGGGRPSAANTVSLVTDNHTPPSQDSPDVAISITGSNPLVNTATTLDSLNIYPAGDVDWFAFRNCNGDSITITAQAVRLTPPSPLNSVLQVLDSLGSLVAFNDAGDSTDARVQNLAITSDGIYRVRVSGGATVGTQGPVGHYRLAFTPKAGANNLTSSCRVTALPVTSIAGMFLHTCAVRTNGNTDCWGNNANGQLGNGTTVNTTSSTKASGTQVLQTVTTGYFHSCGRTSTNTAYCWGSNGLGQVGDGSTTQRATPVAVSGGQSFQVVDAGYQFTCGLNASGTAYCWGDNSNGQLGNGTSTSSSVPVLVSGGLTFTSLAVGDFHACGATAAGVAYCWGYNGDGELGDGTTTNRNVPTVVIGGLVLHGLTAGEYHTCALNAANLAYCWGYNSDGQLGDGTTTPQSSPVPVTGGLSFVQLAAGEYQTCGLTANPGPMYCWGDNYDGQLGDGTTLDRASPTAVAGGAISFTALTAAWFHTCGIQVTSSSAYCWGWNGFGQLGDGSNLIHTGPVPISGGFSFKSITSGGQHSCGITTAGSGVCWGNNLYGEIGDATNTDRLSATPFAGTGYSVVAAGEFFTCALIPASLYCWGANFAGQIGDGTNIYRNVPTLVTGSFSAVTTGVAHTCALSGTTVYCWGRGTEGQLGNAGFVNTNAPGPVPGTYQALGAGGFHSCAIRSGTAAMDCWGNNADGELGVTPLTNRNVPTAVNSAVTTWSQVAVGRFHTCAITTTGVASCWGYNGNGQLGNGNNTSQSAPVTVSGSLVFSSISAGDRHTCGVTTALALYCWGYNFSGQLGLGTFTSFNTPQQVGAQLPWAVVKAGGNQTCGYAATGAAYCWGNNERGQLGYNRRTIAVSPQIVTTGPSATPPIALTPELAEPFGATTRAPRGNLPASEGAASRVGARGRRN